MESVRSLSCDEIIVKLLVPNSNGGGLALSLSRLCAAAPQKEEQGVTHLLDMHCYQLDRMLKTCKIRDPWVGDEAITSGREARAKGMAIELDKLQATLRNRGRSKARHKSWTYTVTNLTECSRLAKSRTRG